MPLFSVVVLGRGKGAKTVGPCGLVPGLNGKTFSKVEEAGCGIQLPAGSPASSALKAFTFTRPISLHASTMLAEQLPVVSTLHPVPAKPGSETLVGALPT